MDVSGSYMFSASAVIAVALLFMAVAIPVYQSSRRADCRLLRSSANLAGIFSTGIAGLSRFGLPVGFGAPEDERFSYAIFWILGLAAVGLFAFSAMLAFLAWRGDRARANSPAPAPRRETEYTPQLNSVETAPRALAGEVAVQELKRKWICLL